MDAYQLCLRAYPLLAANTATNTREALDLLYRAIERDPDYGLPAAFAGWGHAQLVQQIGSATPAEDRARALLMSARAGMLDADNNLVLTARSVVHTMAEERDLAGDLVSRALARNPHLAWAWERSGWLRAYRGDWPGAIATFGRALRLDPTNPAKATLFVGLGAAFFGRGHYALAAHWMKRALQVEPNVIWVNRTLAVAHARLGEAAAARQATEGLRRYRPDIRVRDVAATMHFPEEFVSRVTNGLDDLGLPP
jgi:tetratricopeptide (TPR) repeat protein